MNHLPAHSEKEARKKMCTVDYFFLRACFKGNFSLFKIYRNLFVLLVLSIPRVSPLNYILYCRCYVSEVARA